MCLQNYFNCDDHAGQDAQVAQGSQVLSATPTEHFWVYLGNPMLMMSSCYALSGAELQTKVRGAVGGS